MGLPPFCYEHLLDGRLHLPRRLAKHLRTGGYGAQMHQLQPLALYLLNHHAQDVLLLLFVLGHEHHSRAITSFFRHGDALQQDKLMRDLQHYSCAVARLVACFGTSMLHVLQHSQGLVNQLVALASMYVDHHAHTTCIVLVVGPVESVVSRFKFTLCHIILTFTFQIVTFLVQR